MNAPIITPLESGQLHVWRLHLVPPDSSLPAMTALLSPEERDKAARFRFERDRIRYVAAHAGLRLVLAGYLRCEPAAVLMEPGALGKPLLTGPAALPRFTAETRAPLGTFNLSHSGDWGLLAVGRQQHIGVDLEALRDLPDLAELAETVLSPAELTVFRARPDGQKLACFFQMWTRKEAVVKATSAGIGSALDAIEIEPADPAAGAEFRVSPGLPDAPPLFGTSFQPVVGYSGAAVCESPHPRIVWADWPCASAP